MRDIIKLERELEEIKQKLSSSSGAVSRETKQEVGQEVATTYNEINNFLSVITGNMECLIAEDAVPSQKSLSRLRRTIDAAARLGQASQNILKINLPLKIIEIKIQTGWNLFGT